MRQTIFWVACPAFAYFPHLTSFSTHSHYFACPFLLPAPALPVFNTLRAHHHFYLRPTTTISPTMHTYHAYLPPPLSSLSLSPLPQLEEIILTFFCHPTTPPSLSSLLSTCPTPQRLPFSKSHPNLHTSMHCFAPVLCFGTEQ